MSDRGTSPHRIASLDGLRAIAITMVVISHLVALPAIPSSTMGDTGVRIFFVLSGFLITTLLIQEHSKTGRVELLRFYIRRCFRIFPAFYLYLGVLSVAGASGWIMLRPNDLAKAAFYVVDYCPWDSTSNFVRHIWSLSVEEQFYLVWPVAFWAWGQERAKWVAVGSIVLSPVWRLLVFRFLPAAAVTIDRRFDCISDALASGCLLACLNSTLGGSARYRTALGSRWAHLLPVMVLCAASVSTHPHVYYGFADSVMNLGTALYLHRCILFPPRVLNLGAIRQIGLMSYSIYLWQQLFCSPHEGITRLPALVALAFTLAAASLSYYLIEGPVQRLGRRLTKASGLPSPVDLVRQAR
ncbi:MAG: acyltransferase [Acidobacteriota bacterium]|nr:acyltransferase [Acidobacteriota bacterium]